MNVSQQALDIINTRIAEAVAAERERCSAIVSMARFDEIDRDWRNIIWLIEGGMTVEQIKQLNSHR